MSLIPPRSETYNLSTTIPSISITREYKPITDTTSHFIRFSDDSFQGTLHDRSGDWELDIPIPGRKSEIDCSLSGEIGDDQSILKVEFSGNGGCDIKYPSQGDEQQLKAALGLAARAVVHPLVPANDLPAILKDYQKLVSASIRYQEIWNNSDPSTKHLDVPARSAWNRILRVIVECHEQLTDLNGIFSHKTNKADQNRARRSLAYAVYDTVDGLEIMDENQLKQILGVFIKELLEYISRREKID